MKRLIVVDVSNFIFRAFFAIRPLHSPQGTPVNALYGVTNMLLKLLGQYRSTHLFLAHDSEGDSFRNKIYPQYKANRSAPPEELVPQFALVSDLIKKMEIAHLAFPQYEADDIIGSVCTQWRDHFDEILIVSGDKDLMQLVDEKVKMLDTMKNKIYDDKAVFEKMGVWPKQIVDYLAMVGDSSDNVPGMRGIGAKGAAKLLLEHQSLDQCIAAKEAFTGKKLVTAFKDYLDDALLSKKLVTIATDIKIPITPKDTAYKFYPGEELINFFQEVGFKGILQKLDNIKYGEAQERASSENKFEHRLVKEESDFLEVMKLIASASRLALHSTPDAIALSIDGQTSICLNVKAEFCNSC